MIRYDGYYKDEPVKYEDGISNYTEKGYITHAYYFLNESTFLEAVRKSEDKEVSFSKEDFSIDFPNKYDINGDI